MGVTVGRGVTVGVAVGVATGVAVGVEVGAIVGVAVGVAAGVAVEVTVGVAVGIAEAVGVAVGVAVGITVGVGVHEQEGVGVTVGVAVGGTGTPRYTIATTAPSCLIVYMPDGNPAVLMLALYVPEPPTLTDIDAEMPILTCVAPDTALPETWRLYVPPGTLDNEYVPRFPETVTSVFTAPGSHDGPPLMFIVVTGHAETENRLEPPGMRTPLSCIL